MLNYLETLISGMLPFVLTLTAGTFLSVKTRFFQFRHLPQSIAVVFGKGSRKKADTGLTSFQAVCTALSATVGTGNIAAVAGAIALGGPGAVFWMWVSSLAGMCVKLCEIVLAVIYREKSGDKFVGGPMYYIKKGTKKGFAPFSYIFAVLCVFASFTSGNMTQINTMALSAEKGISFQLTVGVLSAIITFAVLSGGAKRIGKVTEKIVPLMAGLYIILTLGVILRNAQELPDVFRKIITGAFNPAAVTGGAVGSFAVAAVTGASRGLFSNEAGLGTSAIAYASASDDAVKQGLFGIFEVFADTIVICTLTAVTILCSPTNVSYGMNASSELVTRCLSQVYGNLSGVLMTVMLCFFGISSVIGWGFYGINCMEYTFGKKYVKGYTIFYSIICIFGTVCNTDTVWRISGVSNGMMLTVNILFIMLLSPKVIEKLRMFDSAM